MKRIVLILCFVAAFAIPFSGCNDSENHKVNDSGNYEVLVVDFSDSIGSTALTQEYTYWNEDLSNVSDAEPVFSVEINGKQHTGTFTDVRRKAYNNYTTYNYSADDDIHAFSVDQNGQLVSCIWNRSENTLSEQSKLSEKECLAIAKQFLSGFVDVKLYQIETKYRSDRELYDFTFTKHIGDHATVDEAIISVYETGQLSAFNTTMLGRIPVDTQINVDYEKVNNAIYNKLDLLYADAKEKFDEVEYVILSQKIAILDSGDIALICNVDIECRRISGDGTYGVMGERIGLVVRENMNVNQTAE